MTGSADHLARQLAVLRRCAAAGPQRFADLRALLDVPASTLSRQLRALADLDLLRAGRDRRYALGPGATAVALDLLGAGPAPDAALPALADLARQTGASAVCWRLAGRKLILLAKHEVAEGFRHLERFAHRTPESSVFGLALLAVLPAERRARHLRGATPEARRLMRTAHDGLIAGTLPPEPFWRVAAALPGDAHTLDVIGISRYTPPSATVAARDRRCVAAAARRFPG